MRVKSCRFLLGAGTPLGVPELRLPRIAFVGRSNVGKSSLLNRLLGARELARVSRTPGRTRQVNYFLVDERLVLVDMPGYGYARVPEAMRAGWGNLSEAALLKGEGTALAVLLVDGRHPPTELDLLMARWLDSKGLEWLAVLTKMDKLSASDRSKAPGRILEMEGSRRGLATSARTGEGIAELWKEIDAAGRAWGERRGAGRHRAGE